MTFLEMLNEVQTGPDKACLVVKLDSMGTRQRRREIYKKWYDANPEYFQTPEYRERQRVQQEKVRAKPGHTEKMANYYRTNRERYRNGNLKKAYGITLDQFNEMLARQNGRCAICGTDTPRGGKGWHVDHCHSTCRVRGILCGNCNNGLGKFRDDPALLRVALEYLTR